MKPKSKTNVVIRSAARKISKGKSRTRSAPFIQLAAPTVTADYFDAMEIEEQSRYSATGTGDAKK
jgi:hypothetical protein